jgi:hypothetical protein
MTARMACQEFQTRQAKVAGIVNAVLAEGGTTTTTTTKKVEEDFDGLLNACKDYAKCSPASDKCQVTSGTLRAVLLLLDAQDVRHKAGG